MIATFNRFELQMTRAQAESASHSGKCDDDVAALVKAPAIARQLRKLDPDKLRAELEEYGAWEPHELLDDDENKLRITWLAAGNIQDGFMV